MIRTHNKSLQNGSRFDHLFPPAEGKNQTVKKGAVLQDTVKLIRKVINKYSPQAREIARELQGKTLDECCRNIWEFCTGYIDYNRDEEGTEQIRTPARSWADRKITKSWKDENGDWQHEGGIDCDCYAVLSGSILRQMHNPETGRRGIGCLLRITKYPDPEGENPNPDFSHIYVVVKGRQKHYIIDPVHDRYDEEVPYLDKRDIKMDLQILNGIPGKAHNDILDLQSTRHGDLGYLVSKADLKKELGKDSDGRKTVAQIVAEKAASQGMTPAQYRDKMRQEFIRQHGMSPEQHAAKIRAQQAKVARENAAKAAAQQAKNRQQEEQMRKELRKRGVAFSPTASRQELIDLMNKNPRPKPVAAVINKINKVNPATLLVRQGIRLIIAKNMKILGIAEGFAKRLAPALLTRKRADEKGYDLKQWDDLAGVWGRMKNTYFGVGGDLNSLKDAVLKGSGGVEGEALAGLGEPATGTAITAAMTVMAAIAALLKSVGSLKTRKSGEAPSKVLQDAIRYTGAGAAALQTFKDNSLPAPNEAITTYEVHEEKIDKGRKQPPKEPVDWGKVGLIAGALALVSGGIAWAVSSGKEKKASTKNPAKKRSTTRRKRSPPRLQTANLGAIEIL